MDPFEEFEFKPLTDGLGFHKKKSSAPTQESTKADSFTQSLLLDQDPLRPPLPRRKHSNQGSSLTPESLVEGETGSSSAVDEILKTLQKNRRIDFDNGARKISQTTPTTEDYKTTSFSFSAALLDGMLILASSLLCMIILLIVTKVDLISNLTNPDSEGMIYVATVSLFATISFVYLTLNRIYLGWTPGEWAFDQRIGKPEELNRAIYSLKVVARTFLVLGTGFILIPILSVLFNKDFAGVLTGARLYRKV